MKKATMIAFGVALLATSWPSWAQNPQDTNDMQLWEFRQVLVDLGSYLDAHKGTDFQRQFATMPDNVIENWYPAVKNPREFQKAVMGLKQHDASMAARRAERRVDASLLPRAVAPILNGPICRTPIWSRVPFRSQFLKRPTSIVQDWVAPISRRQFSLGPASPRPTLHPPS